MSSTSWPIAIISFNRPDYLAQVLDSLLAQHGGIDGRRIALFQDGAWSPTMNRHHTEPALIEKCVEIFHNKIPQGDVFVSDTNLGIAMNIDRAERFIFETLGADAGIFVEEDLVLGPVYLRVLERLIEFALADERIGYVAAFGNFRASIEDQIKNPCKLRPLHLLWGFGLTRRHWLKCRPYIQEYVDIVRDVDYRQRNHGLIRDLVASWGVKPGDTGQDRIKSFATALVGATKFNTEVCYAKYIGKEGFNFTPEVYKKWGFQDSTLVSEVQSLDFDLAGSNFEPWFEGNNVWKIDSSAAPIVQTQSPIVGSKSQHIVSPQKKGSLPILLNESAVNAHDETLTKATITAAYRAILRREPDPVGLVAYERLFRNGDFSDAIERTMTGLIQSSEFSKGFASGQSGKKLEDRPSEGSTTLGFESVMVPRMSKAELQLFESYVRCADKYLEFGAGGSTCFAAGHVKSSVTSIDSSAEWLEKTAQSCVHQQLPVTPDLFHVDIGPLGDWGAPTDKAARPRWPDYHRKIWNNPTASDHDLYFVDGRFRVACVMQILLHCEPEAFIIVHDFQSRKQYHVVKEVSREIARAEDISVFQKIPGTTRIKIREILYRYEFDWS